MLLMNPGFKNSHCRTKRIFFTGGTGFIGQFLAIELLKAGHFLIFLARKKGDLTAEKRISSALVFADTGIYNKYRNQYRVIEGDLDNLPGYIEADEIFHLAGSTSFNEENRLEIYKANLQGTKNVLNLAKKIRPSAIHYVSTAYVCNPSKKTAYEVPADCYTTFNNPYAESKCRAEEEILGFSEINPDCNVFIYRPSIIIGRSWDGITTNFTGFYRYMQPFSRICNKIRKRNNIDNKKIIDLPIWVPGNQRADINIVNIDYAVDIMTKIWKRNIPGIYHITNPEPPTYGWLLEESLRALNISGPSPLQKPAETPENLKKLEAAIEKGVEKYIAFVTAENCFDVSQVQYALDRDYYSHPIINSDMIQTLLEFAVRCDFKKDNAINRTKIPFKKYLPPLPVFPWIPARETIKY